MNTLSSRLSRLEGAHPYLKIEKHEQRIVEILAVNPPSQLPPETHPNALGMAIAESVFTVKDGAVTQEVSGRHLIF